MADMSRKEKVEAWRQYDHVPVADFKEKNGKGKPLSEMDKGEFDQFLAQDQMRMVYLFELRATEFRNFVKGRGWG